MLYRCDMCCFKNASEYKYNVHMKSKAHLLYLEMNDLQKEIDSFVPTPMTTHPLEKDDPKPIQPLETTHPLEKGDPKPIQPLETKAFCSTFSKVEFNLDNYLNEICKDAFNFDDFVQEYLLHPDHNNWISYVGNGDNDDLMLLHHIDYSLYPESISFGSSFFCKVFSTLEYFQKPIFCSNMKQHNFYIKENNRWKLIDTDLLYKKIFGVVIKSLTVALRNTMKLSGKNFKHIYKIEKESFDKNYCDELSVIIFGIDRDDLVKKLNLDLPRLCSRNQVMYDCPKPNKWTEFKDDSLDKSDCESD